MSTRRDVTAGVERLEAAILKRVDASLFATEFRRMERRIGNAGTLGAKHKLLSCQADDERTGRTRSVTPTLHTVYVAGEQSEREQFAAGSFGFVYRRRSRDLRFRIRHRTGLVDSTLSSPAAGTDRLQP